MIENPYTPPKFRTVTPPIEHLRTTPNYTHIRDKDRKQFFTNYNKELMEIIRQIKNN